MTISTPSATLLCFSKLFRYLQGKHAQQKANYGSNIFLIAVLFILLAN